ncbi:hypothetical protein FBR02_00145 [Anaerolineae bacterium CFX9]|nr:hypothetical protein [Anaerolineae bacterium CFX9]NOG48722.1 hypothetical protein [Chloroflexota bacterium]GIK76137.1 MAG: hypothetical protein BroJett021_51250 [Chloroflexota bacterium]
MAREKSEADVLELLQGEAAGLELGAIIERLGLEDEVSSRTVRNMLNGLVDEGVLVRQKQRTGSPGKPPYIYILPAFVPQQLRLFGDAKLDVLTITEANLEELDYQERDRIERGLSALETIARGHIQEDRFAKAIIRIAPQVATENPVELLTRMAGWVVEDINRTASELTRLRNARASAHEIDNLAGRINVRLQMARQYFHNLWCLDKDGRDEPIMDLPTSADEILRYGRTASINVDLALERLRSRVAGETVIYEWQPGDNIPTSAVGTDASVADVYLQHATGKFMRPDPVAVMIAAAAQITRENGSIIGEFQDFDVFPDDLKEYEEHTAARNGLIISPAMREILPESDFKHSRLAAMELRQYVEDLRIVLGQARWRPIGELQNLNVSPHKASLIIRDGRVFPLVHRLNDYEDGGLYGQIVRNQIKRFASVIHHTMSGPEGDIVYGAAVKDPQQSWIAPLVFWYAYINQGEEDTILSREDIYKYPFTDTAVSHLLFLGIANGLTEFPQNRLLVTFRAKRRFSDIAITADETPKIEVNGSFRHVDVDDENDWKLFIKQRIAEANRRGRKNVLPDERDYNYFTYLCSRVGVSMFYAAPESAYELLVQDNSEGAGHFLLCRLEVSVKVGDEDHEVRSMEGMLAWLASGGWEFDHAHNPTGFDTGQGGGIPILVPDVVVPSHETVTFARDQVGEEVEDALRQLITELRKRV